MSRLEHLLHLSLATTEQAQRECELIARLGHRTRLGVCVVTGRPIAERFDRRNHFLSAEGARGGR